MSFSNLNDCYDAGRKHIRQLNAEAAREEAARPPQGYRVLPPDLRNTFPEIWRGFDLRGLKLDQEFFGCEKCGVQMNAGGAGTACCTQCPNCIQTMEVFRVTQADLDAAASTNEGY